MARRIDVDPLERTHPRFVLEQAGDASSELTTHPAHENPHTRHMLQPSPGSPSDHCPDNWWRRSRRWSVVIVATAAAVGVSVTGEARAIVGEAASVESVAHRVVPDPADGLLLFPVNPYPRCVVADNFGGHSKAGRANGHEGVDIGADEGTALYAVEDGELTRQLTDLGASPGLGWVLLADSGTEYRYYHLHEFAAGLAVGDRVERGQVIGSVGSTGNAHPTGWHLHFEVRPGPQPERGSAPPVDPVPLLDIPENCVVY